MLNIAAVCIISYLVGSIPFGLIIGRLWKGIDIRNYGSKNAGFTNVYRVVGTLPAIIVLVLDIAKGMASVLLITRIVPPSVSLNPIDLKLIACLCVILGHVFPVFAGFRGGKGIATGLGALVSIIPVEIGLALILFVLIVAATRFISLGSLSATALVMLALVVEKYYLNKDIPTTLLLTFFLLTVFIFFNHRGNIKRLLQGKENKFGRKKVDSESTSTKNPEEKN
jgi:glycerol-3-phosphate acyltransferase PlsY